MRRIGQIVVVLLIAGVVLLVLLPTIMIGFEGGFRWREMASRTSFDGKLQITISKRIAFPANEWIDPAIIVRAELHDTASQRLLSSASVKLLEDSDFDHPTFQWQQSAVVISGFDRRQPQTITLKHAPVPEK